jgi:hypothetical protein
MTVDKSMFNTWSRVVSLCGFEIERGRQIVRVAEHSYRRDQRARNRGQLWVAAYVERRKRLAHQAIREGRAVKAAQSPVRAPGQVLHHHQQQFCLSEPPLL